MNENSEGRNGDIRVNTRVNTQNSSAEFFSQASTHTKHDDDSQAEQLALAPAFTAMLERLCVLAEVPPAERGDVIASRAMRLADIPMVFQLEEWSGFVKIYVDVGEPMPASAHEMYRYFLQQQLYMPVPFQMTFGLHPESERIILYACAPLSVDEESDQNFLALLHSCVLIINELRTNWTEKSLAMNPEQA